MEYKLIQKLWIAGGLVATGFFYSYGIEGSEKEHTFRTSHYITEQEKIRMLNEADDYIDEIPEGQADRQADAVLHALHGSGAELQAIRESISKGIESSGKVDIRDITPSGGIARGLDMRLYQSKYHEKYAVPLLIYIHGGGWTFGNVDCGQAFCEAVSATGQVEVLAIDYSLAPENPFPQGLYDCVAAVEYVFENAEELGTSVGMVSLGGEGAGGNLALATALSLSENTEIKGSVKSLLLYNPIVDMENGNSGSWKRYSRGYGFDRRLMDAFIMAYDDKGKAPVSFGSFEKRVFKSPLKATDEQLGKLPPILMISSDRDILFDQGKEFAAKVERSDVRVDRIEFPGAVHSFISQPGQNTAFDKAVALTVSFLTEK